MLVFTACCYTQAFPEFEYALAVSEAITLAEDKQARQEAKQQPTGQLGIQERETVELAGGLPKEPLDTKKPIPRRSSLSHVEGGELEEQAHVQVVVEHVTNA